MKLDERVVPLSCPDITELERTAVLNVLRTPHLSLGPTVRRFEEKFSEYLGVKHAVAVNSGTSALHLAVKALNIGDGDEVLTTPFSFIASANCLLFERAKPVFVDIDYNTFNLDPNELEARITPRTKAILPVHVFGMPCDMDPILNVARRHSLRLIEDACEALGATYRDRMVGTFGDCSVFAFYPNKQMTTGEGGVLATNDSEIADLCRSCRNQGRASGPGWLAHERIGFNYRLSDIHSALGLAQLQRVEELLRKRMSVAALYESCLRNVPGLSLPIANQHSRRSWFVYVILLEERFGRENRDQILDRLARRGVGCSNYFPPIHLQPFYRSSFGYKPGDFPITESISGRTIALPFYGDLCKDDIQYVGNVLKAEMSSIFPA